MRRILILIAAIFGFAVLAARNADAQADSSLSGDVFATPHTHVKLVLSAAAAKPGDTIWAGVDLKMDAGWHTYWKNAGDAGIPTKIEWQLPPGISAGEIQWPLPQKLPPAEVTTYGYENEVMLLVPLKIETNFPPGQVDLKANVSWLECQDSCVPGAQDVETKLNIGSETKTSADAAAIETWKSKVPATDHFKMMSQQAWWESSTNSDARPLIIDRRFLGDLAASVPLDNADFFPDASDNFEIQPQTEKIIANSSEVKMRLLVKKFSGDWPKEISGVLVTKTGGKRQGIAVKFSIANQAPANETISSPANPGPSVAQTKATPALPSQPLWKMLLFAFIGGLILNIMPCVLPVIALKILGFVSEARSEPRHVRALGLVYALGVLASFLVLAAIVIGVKASGLLPGWGMQFGNPIFLVCLTTLVTLVALNLFGVFEIAPGGKILNAAGQLASKHGAAGAFFNGILATILATPCTAPFLGTALGFAFLQPPAIIVLIFLFVGLGLAAPYVLLSWHPAWLKFLPKPGAWMEKFKIALGFPMLATVMWLFYIAGSTYGKDVAWLGGFLVVVALAAWIFGEFIQRGRSRKILAGIIILVLLVGGYVFILEDELNWRAPVIATSAASPKSNAPDAINWEPWSPAVIAQARAGGHPVIVDFTADWCLTCQVNKKTSIEIPSVEKKLKKLNVVTLVGDYTHFPQSITKELLRFGRAGVPLVLVYSKDAAANPVALPEVLTPGIVLKALAAAAK